MTKLIQQQTGSDCFLACLAMAKGVGALLDLWTQEDLDAVVKACGVGDETPWMNRAGYYRFVDYRAIHTSGSSDYELDRFKQMLWGRRAILSVKSLNLDGGSHAVYWDGEALYDPSPLRTYGLLSSVYITQILLFKD